MIIFDTVIGLIDKHLLQKYGNRLHYGMITATGIVVAIILTELFTTILRPHTNSALLNVVGGSAMAYIDLYVAIGLTYQVCRFYSWRQTTRIF